MCLRGSKALHVYFPSKHHDLLEIYCELELSYWSLCQCAFEYQQGSLLLHLLISEYMDVNLAV